MKDDYLDTYERDSDMHLTWQSHTEGEARRFHTRLTVLAAAALELAQTIEATNFNKYMCQGLDHINDCMLERAGKIKNLRLEELNSCLKRKLFDTWE